MGLSFGLTIRELRTVAFSSHSRISNQKNININKHMEQNKPRYATKSPGRGGARPGAGRPKGTSPRYTLEQLTEHLEAHAGMSFAERVAMNYVGAINRSDWAGVRDYDRVLLGKMVADKQQVETVESEDAVAAKAEAFAEALAELTKVGKKS